MKNEEDNKMKITFAKEARSGFKQRFTERNSSPGRYGTMNHSPFLSRTRSMPPAFRRLSALLLLAALLLFGLSACSGQDAGALAADSPAGSAQTENGAQGDSSDSADGEAQGDSSTTDASGQGATDDSLAPLLNGEKNGGGTASVALSNPDAANSADSDVIEVREKMFVGQMNDMFLNPDDYVGKTIRYEGFYDYFENEALGEQYDYVVRNGPGCCGYDSLVGLEIFWDGEMPQKNDWCRVQGVLEAYEEDGGNYLVLNLESLEVLPVRGNDTVTQ
jgi:hypothetical protein